MANRGKHAPMEIYRPPNIRTETPTSSSTTLNVHAKEFVMSSKKNDTPQTPPNFLLRDTNEEKEKKQTSGTSKTNHITFKQPPSSQNSTKPSSVKQNGHSSSNFNLQRAKSSSSMDYATAPNTQRVQFKTPPSVDKSDHDGKKLGAKDRRSIPNFDQNLVSGLKRSKSLTAADALKFLEMEAAFSKCSVSFSEYHLFPKESHAVMKQAVEDVNVITDKQKMTLARYVIEHVLRDKKYCHPVAKLSIIIMERDNNGTYLDSLLNTCQMLYQTKQTRLLIHPSQFILFVAFLTEMYTEMKQSKLQLKFQSDPVTPPKQVLLMLVSRCCEDMLTIHDMHSLSEIECLFRALTSVGRDLELELPARLNQLYDKIKEVFLKSNLGPEIKKVMLQLIELRATGWQLPLSALNFYYPQSSN
ncbi:uncharacterized protein LOC135835181 isoform X2 [Planococcus citri]